MKPLYIIPARGGSKGIPGKNIKPLAGRPLIAYTLDAARAVEPDPRRIILSTDSEAIANAVQRMEHPVDYMRPAALATDSAPMQPVIVDALDWAGRRGLECDCVVLLQPTSPLRSPDDILATVALLEATPAADMAVTVAECADNPYYNMFEPGADGLLAPCKGDGLLTRRQDAPPVYRLNGAVYAIRPGALRTVAMGRMARVAHVMPAERSIDIDSPLDWLAAENSLTCNR